jgi:hypothetical protein
MEERIRYAGVDAFSTFPMVNSDMPALSAMWSALLFARGHYMAITWQGLTTTYNQLKDPDYAGDLAAAAAARPTDIDRTRLPGPCQTGWPAVPRSPPIPICPARPPASRASSTSATHEELDRAVLPPMAGPTSSSRRTSAAPRRSRRPGHPRPLRNTIIDHLFALNARRRRRSHHPSPSSPSPEACPRHPTSLPPTVVMEPCR